MVCCSRLPLGLVVMVLFFNCLVPQSVGLVGNAPVLPEQEWRPRAQAHKERVLRLLEDGFVQEDAVPQRYVAFWKNDGFRRLNERHAVFNFLNEYYNIRGLPYVTLQGATQEDIDAGTLSPLGCEVHDCGLTYDARSFFHSSEPSAATPFMWYYSLLATTAQAEPILHCFNLHEWAMQYWPAGETPPPSQKYQQETMPLRVSQQTINDVVEGLGIRCTHVDALRFFAPAAGPLNRHGASLEREQQLDLEQPGCLHAHMDLFKISLRLAPWLPAELQADALEIALAARSLDVAASPYDASKFGIAPVAIETEAGRMEFRKRQVELMHRAEPVRTQLLSAYEKFLQHAFGKDRLAQAAPSPERFARAEPGGLPWHRNLIERQSKS